MRFRRSLIAILSIASVLEYGVAYAQTSLTAEQQQVVASCQATCNVQAAAAAIAAAGEMGPAMIAAIVPNLPVDVAAALVSAAVSNAASPQLALQIAQAAVSAAPGAMKNALAAAAVRAAPDAQKQAMGVAMANAGASDTGDVDDAPGSQA